MFAILQLQLLENLTMQPTSKGANWQYKYGMMFHYLCFVVNFNMDKKLYMARTFIKATRNINLDSLNMSDPSAYMYHIKLA